MLKGVTALVTGGASGLGKATVERIVKQGGSVVICDLPTSKGAEVVKDVGKERAAFVPTDVTSADDVLHALQVCKSRFGALNTVVNCAGIGIAQLTYHHRKKVPHSLEDFSRVLKVNAAGTFNVIRLAAKDLSESPADDDGIRGVIVNTASVAAFDGQRGQAAYSASKGAIVGMTLPIARELSACGIRVCTVAPGVFSTPLMMSLPKEAQENLVKNVPLPKRLGHPDEFARLIESIITNPMLNGEVIRLDGALRMQP